MDVKIVFLHSDLEKEIYMLQPEGFEVKWKEHLICRLKKPQYVLKQAPRHGTRSSTHSFMVGHGYTKTDANHCVYI